MPFSQQIAAAIAAACTYQQLDTLGQQIAAAWAAGQIGDEPGQAAFEAIQERRRALTGRRQPTKIGASWFRRPPRPRASDRDASICRRRAEVATGMLPPHIAANFTLGEQAALSVVARDVQINGQCDWCVDKIAGIAGVSARTVQRAQRHAERLGFITIEARPRPGRKSDTNVITITSPEWATWLLMDRVTKKSGHGIQKDNYLLKQRRDPASWRFPSPAERSSGLARGGGGKAPPLAAAVGLRMAPVTATTAPRPTGPIAISDALKATDLWRRTGRDV